MAKQLTDDADIANSRKPSSFDESVDLATLALQQGVKPLDFDELRAKADFWPEHESIDEFIATIRHWREEGDLGDRR
jgi:hypothetical protein